MQQLLTGALFKAAGGRGDQLRRRWNQQRSLAMQPLGAAAGCGSEGAAAAALDSHALLDSVSGKRLPWESGGITFESTDGSTFATSLLDPGGDDAAGVPRSLALRAWLGTSPPCGGSWKRMRRVDCADS